MIGKRRAWRKAAIAAAATLAPFAGGTDSFADRDDTDALLLSLAPGF